jgi:hypothetical protein
MTESPVRRRHVFYLNGFDPKGAAYVHGLYARQAQLQGQVAGVRYEVGDRERRPNGNSQWTVRCDAAGQRTHTVFEYVRWDDIVRAHWPRSPWAVLAGSLRGYAAALASWSALRKVWQHSRRTLVSLAYPALFWLGALLLAISAAFGVAATLPPPWGAAAGAAAAAAVLGLALLQERRLNTSWLLRIYQFAGDWRHGRTPEVPRRTAAAAEDIVQALRDPQLDEVLLVAFSVGSLLAVSTAARVQQLAAAQGLSLERFSLVTLGHCIPLLGLMAGADAYRGELAQLGGEPRVQWVDFSSPTDWGSFPLVDPLAICLGPASAQRPHSPRMLSPRFHTMFDPAVYAELVRDKRRLHLQYIMAGERPALYDFFAITAGPERLPARLKTAPAA